MTFTFIYAPGSDTKAMPAEVIAAVQASTEPQKATHKSQQEKLRRRAARYGLLLQKSRARNWSLDNQLGYRLLEPQQNIVLFGRRYDLDLDDIDFILTPGNGYVED